MSRPTRTELVSVHARCERCAISLDAKNAQALAAKHHDKTGHTIKVRRVEEIVYGAQGTRAGKVREQGRLL